MIYLMATLWVLGFIAGGIYLIMYGHWALGLLCLLLASGVTVSAKKE